jgi:hypothetical protein
LELTGEKKFWYKRFRNAAYITIVGSAVWTIAIVLPLMPFSYLPPIIVGGGPGTWFLLGYVLYLTVGVGGLAALSALIFAIETYEGRILNEGIMMAGLTLLFSGVTVGCVLLGVAGVVGGYALTIQHTTVETVQNTLELYVDPITLASLVAVAGAGVSVFGMVTAKATAA